MIGSRKLGPLEAEYYDQLVAALQICAAGRWGLFGQNDQVIADEPKPFRERLKSKEADILISLGEEISALRQRLGITEEFPLHKRFLQTRASAGPNTPGEPRLARAWLEELDADQKSKS